MENPKTVQNLEFALTLTTGSHPTKLIIRNISKKLNYLLRKYIETFEKYIIYIEILDKNYMETKVHYHGYMIVKYNKLYNYNRFVKEYEELLKGYTDNKIITDREKWLKYISKQHEILKNNYSNVIDKFIHTDENVDTTINYKFVPKTKNQFLTEEDKVGALL